MIKKILLKIAYKRKHHVANVWYDQECPKLQEVVLEAPLMRLIDLVRLNIISSY